MSTNNSLAEALARAKPVKLPERHQMRRSAVAVVLDSDVLADASLLLIRRAQHERDPWSGHMAFPGGRKEDFDRNGLATAKREMHEEVGFDIDAASAGSLGRVIGRLSDFSTRRRAIPIEMIVSPYVFQIEARPRLSPNYEVDDALWIPLAYFADPANRSKIDFEYNGRNHAMPSVPYSDSHVVWGMTLKMIDELLAVVGAGVPDGLRSL
ncbi:MAG: CoA pyrophosphatase [Pseudomonadales bacterium]|nr:CoA pyrophosphatase [Pseudomonadales bacterium]